MKRTNPIEEHRLWLEAYRERSAVAQENPFGPTAPLTEEQRQAYFALPILLDECEAAWSRIPEPERSVHYLLSV
jgi:hypothetical protein